MTSLRLADTAITDKGLAHLRKLPAIHYIGLWNCQGITDKGLAHLHDLPGLDEIVVVDCEHVTEEGLTALSAAKPDCRIVRKWSGAASEKREE